MTHRRILFALYLMTLLFVGIGYLAMTPVFEGFDEYAHYSSIRQIAGTGTMPVLGESHIDALYEDYRGPRAYGHDAPPFDSGLVYSKFFAQPDLAEEYKWDYREAPASVPYRSGSELNWQAQHPPLYYILMAPVMTAVRDYSLVTQFFVLRLVSFLFVLAGVALGFVAAGRWETPQRAEQPMIGFFLYPVILPMFFPEFLRIGNDALCVFLLGVLAYLLAVWREDELNGKAAFGIGVVLGLGLLTKAFFLPVTLALGLFLVLRLWREEEQSAQKTRHFLTLLCMFYPALLIGGGWYVYSATHFGVLGGGIDSVILAKRGGMLAGLSQHFSLLGLGKGLGQFVMTSSWAGTWSLTLLPLIFRLPLVGAALWVAVIYMRSLRQRAATDFVCLPVWLFGFFGVGILYHMAVGLALDGHGQTPGWYVHVFMPFAAPAVGIGLCAILQNQRTRMVAIGLLVYAVLFQCMALWSQFALFTGCATKNDEARYAFSGSFLCFDQAPALVERLGVLGWPGLAATGFGGGLLCAAAMLGLWRREQQRLRTLD